MTGCNSEATPPHFKQTNAKIRAGLARVWREGCLRVWRARTGAEVIGANGGYDAGGWGDYADAVAVKIIQVFSAGCDA